jgi:3-oxoacyl-[acyl-carrier-protein] synthase-3
MDPGAKDRVDFLIFCTQTPDYFLPSTSCIVQDRLDLPTTVGALDINLGCSGHVYGLSLAKGLIASGQATSVLLITAETYTHVIHPADRSVRSLFGDASAATLIEASNRDSVSSAMRGFTFGSDGGGSQDLIIRGGGFRDKQSGRTEQSALAGNIHMNGQGVFNFTRQRIPAAVTETLSRAGVGFEEIDLFIFHQASWLVIESLQRALKIPAEKCWFGIENIGNTVSSTIPIALAQAAAAGRLKPGDQILLAGFGVGLSWACAVVEWQSDFMAEIVNG